MRLIDCFRSSSAKVVACALSLGATAIGSAEAAAAPAECASDARVRDLEARLAAAEARLGAGESAQAAAAVSCRSANVVLLGMQAGSAPLTITINGTRVGSYPGNLTVPLDGFLRRGVNNIGLAYGDTASATADARLTCLPPTGPRATILMLRPTPGNLQGQAQLNFTGS